MELGKGSMWLLCLLSIALAASPACGGWVVVEVSGPEGGPEEITTIYVENNRLKIVESEIMILDVNKNCFYALLPAQKIYTEGTPDDLAKQHQMASERMAQMRKMQEQHLQQLPPEQREMARKQMESMMPPGSSPGEKMTVEIKETSDKEKIAGYDTRKYQVIVNGELAEDVWVSDRIQFTDEVDLDKLYDLMDSMRGPGAAQSYETSPEYRALMKKGVRLRSVDYSEGDADRTEVRKVEKKTVPDSEFEIPEGYRKVGLREFGEAEAAQEEAYDSETEHQYGEVEYE